MSCMGMQEPGRNPVGIRTIDNKTSMITDEDPLRGLSFY